MIETSESFLVLFAPGHARDREDSVTEATYCAGLILFRCVSGVYLICDIYERLVIYKNVKVR